MDVQAWLAGRFQHAAAKNVDALIAIDVGDRRLTTFSVNGDGLRFDPGLRPDATFIFDGADTALAVLAGEEDPIAAFMAGRFRADGNLPLAFVLLGLFRPDYGVDAPP